MKPLSFVRALFCAIVLLTAGALNTRAGVFKNWTNSAGGNYFDPFGWSPNGVPQAGDAVTITNNGTYTVIAPTGTVATAEFIIGGASGKQTFIYGTTASFQFALSNSVVQNNGVLVVTNAGLTGGLLIQAGGELQLNSAVGLFLYNMAITNRGTMTWSNGSLTVGGSNSQSTYVTNSGLWQILGDVSMGSGGGAPSVCFNSGTIKKVAGIGAATFGMDVVNSSSGIVDVASGVLKLAPNSTNFLSGSFVAENTNIIQYIGNESDAGGVASGTGLHQFTFGTFYFRTSTIPNLKLTSGDVYIIGKTTFQNAGAITNLTLHGAVLHGTNSVSGALTLNAGNLDGQLTVLPSGQLNLTSPFGIQFYGLTLFNQGSVNWSGNGSIAVGTTVISNGGTWTITGDSQMSNGGSAAYFTNAGTIQKTSGTNVSTVQGFTFVNLPVGVIRVASGTLQMPNNYTNVAGELQLAGGTLTAGLISSVTMYMTGGKLDGFGTIGSAAQFDGGVVQPGPTAGLMRFQSGLVLGTNCTLALDGTGTVPGVSFDQLSVTGAVAISNCTLQISLPQVPGATRFVIITNGSVTPVTGSFNGLPEDAPLTINGQPFHIHYSGGSGNDVVLMRDLSGGPLLSTVGYTNKAFLLSGIGNNPATIYTIQASTNFLQWTNVGTATGDVNGQFSFTDTNAPNFHFRFYRTTN